LFRKFRISVLQLKLNDTTPRALVFAQRFSRKRRADPRPTSVSVFSDKPMQRNWLFWHGSRPIRPINAQLRYHLCGHHAQGVCRRTRLPHSCHSKAIGRIIPGGARQGTSWPTLVQGATRTTEIDRVTQIEREVSPSDPSKLNEEDRRRDRENLSGGARVFWPEAASPVMSHRSPPNGALLAQCRHSNIRAIPACGWEAGRIAGANPTVRDDGRVPIESRFTAAILGIALPFC